MDTSVTRRRVIGSVGAAGIAGLAGCGGGGDGGNGGDGGDGGDGGTSTDQQVSGEVTVGMVQTLSGALKYYGQVGIWGFYSALKYKGGEETTIPTRGDGPGEYTVTVGDVDYRLLVSDDGGDADEAQNLATEHVQSGDADILYGASQSASATSIATNVANKAGVPYIIGPAAGSSLTGSSETCSENVFRASETDAMNARAGGKYIAEETDLESVWIYYADYSYGRTVMENYRQVLEDAGVQVEGTTPLAADYSEDWPGQFSKAVDADVDGVIGGFTVAALPAMVETFLANNDQYDFQLVGSLPTMQGLAPVSQTMQNQLGDLTAQKIKDAGLGPFTSRYTWHQQDNPVNDAFVDIYSERYGTYPDTLTGGTFAAGAAVHEAVQKEGATDSDAIRSGLTGLTVQDTPKGEGGFVFQDYNNQAKSSISITYPVPTENEDLWTASVQPGESLRTYGKDETTLPADHPSMNCSL